VYEVCLETFGRSIGAMEPATNGTSPASVINIATAAKRLQVTLFPDFFASPNFALDREPCDCVIVPARLILFFIWSHERRRNLSARNENTMW
jgi:hypothetical protein